MQVLTWVLSSTKAEPGARRKLCNLWREIFISAGEHDMAENIVHIKRIGTFTRRTYKVLRVFLCLRTKVQCKCRSLFLGEHNAVRCGSIEHKMGLHGNATCVINFDNAKGFLIGPENRGLNCMFTFMNTAAYWYSRSRSCSI